MRSLSVEYALNLHNINKLPSLLNVLYQNHSSSSSTIIEMYIGKYILLSFKVDGWWSQIDDWLLEYQYRFWANSIRTMSGNVWP